MLPRDPLQEPVAFTKAFNGLVDAIQLVNSCLTFPLVLVMFHFFILNLFVFFNLLWTLITDFEKFLFVAATDGVYFVFNYLLQGIMTHASCTTTHEAERTLVIASKLMNKRNCSKSGRKLFKNFLVHNQCRGLKFENMFFTINWKLLLAVRVPAFNQQTLLILSFIRSSQPPQHIFSSHASLNRLKRSTNYLEWQLSFHILKNFE